jgi:hypothetical protein
MNHNAANFDRLWSLLETNKTSFVETMQKEQQVHVERLKANPRNIGNPEFISMQEVWTEFHKNGSRKPVTPVVTQPLPARVPETPLMRWNRSFKDTCLEPLILKYTSQGENEFKKTGVYKFREEAIAFLDNHFKETIDRRMKRLQWQQQPGDWSREPRIGKLTETRHTAFYEMWSEETRTDQVLMYISTLYRKLEAMPEQDAKEDAINKKRAEEMQKAINEEDEKRRKFQEFQAQQRIIQEAKRRLDAEKFEEAVRLKMEAMRT